MEELVWVNGGVFLAAIFGIDGVWTGSFFVLGAWRIRGGLFCGRAGPISRPMIGKSSVCRRLNYMSKYDQTRIAIIDTARVSPRRYSAHSPPL